MRPCVSFGRTMPDADPQQRHRVRVFVDFWKPLPITCKNACYCQWFRARRSGRLRRRWRWLLVGVGGVAQEVEGQHGDHHEQVRSARVGPPKKNRAVIRASRLRNTDQLQGVTGSVCIGAPICATTDRRSGRRSLSRCHAPHGAFSSTYPSMSDRMYSL